MPKMAKIAAANEPTAIYLFVCILFLLSLSCRIGVYRFPTHISQEPRNIRLFWKNGRGRSRISRISSCTFGFSPARAQSLSAPKSREPLRLRLRFFTAFLGPEDAQFPLRSKIASEWRFSLRLLNGENAGKVNFCTGTGRKAFFEFFSAWFWTPPGTYAFTAKKGKFICTGHFFPHGMAFLEKRGGLVPVYVFIFPGMVPLRKYIAINGDASFWCIQLSLRGWSRVKMEPSVLLAFFS